MKRNYFVLVLLAAFIFCTYVTPAEADWDWSLGLVSVDIGSDLGQIINDGFGLSLGSSNRFSKSLSFEFLWDMSFHDTSVSPKADLTYNRFDIGLRYFPFSGLSIDLYGSAGLALHFMSFHKYVDEIDGLSLFYGGGVEFPVGKSGALDFGVRFSDWEGDWTPGGPNIDAKTTAIQAVYRFRY